MTDAMDPPVSAWQPLVSYRGLFARFLRFGLLAFGGPVAQIAMLRRELVEEEGWVSSSRFNRLLAVYQALPGPEAHELAVHLGLTRGGRVGALLAGLGFMLPGFLLMLAISWLYFQVDLTQASIGAALLGAQVAVVALVVRAVERIGRHVLVDPGLWLIAFAAAAATAAGVSFWVTLPIAGVAYALAPRFRAAVVYGTVIVAAAAATVWVAATTGLPLLQPGAGPTGPGSGGTVEASVPAIFLSGLKAGLLTFGGAYTAIPFIRGDAVGNGWLTDAQFLDGLALGSVLPAPLIIFGTFVGYVAGGPVGAIAMTAGIFLPAFSFALLLGDRIERVVDNPGLHRLVGGIAAGVVGLIAVTALELGGAVAIRLPAFLPGVVIFGASLAVLFLWRSKAAVPLTIAAAALAGWLAFGGL
jgi:chromate transporter